MLRGRALVASDGPDGWRLVLLNMPPARRRGSGVNRGREDMIDAEPETTSPKQSNRWQRGQSGNPSGRPKGARHAALMALDAIGAAAAREVMQAVVTAAVAGDMRASEILLRRLWPERKGRPLAMELPPIGGAGDLPAAVGAVVEAVAAGDLTADEGQAIAGILETQRRAIETADLAARIEALELAGGGKR